jgi:hypothetical protein
MTEDQKAVRRRELADRIALDLLFPSETPHRDDFYDHDWELIVETLMAFDKTAKRLNALRAAYRLGD